MKLMALDYGDKYIGIAVNEPLFMTVHGRDTLVRRSMAEDLSYLLRLASKEEIDLLVIGLPLNECGEETETSAKVRSFARQLNKKMRYSSSDYRPFETVFWDERFTTLDADLILEEDEIPRSERKKYVDKLAAVLLLENYIAENDFRSERNHGRTIGRTIRHHHVDG